ncbi:MAG: c-type cytochrome [Anaerolineales bacterium]|nr:c-type cytochrome [Anaerolineales bacterium]
MDTKLDPETNKERYHERYDQAKQSGVKFFPDIIYKDLLVAFGIFLLLVGLAVFVGVKSEPPADPGDSTYIPRPEWYFLFLFQFLKYFPGKIEWIGTTLVPVLAIAALFLLPFIDRSPLRHWKHRRKVITIMGVIVMGMAALTILAVVETPPMEEISLANSLQEQYAAGEGLYGFYCVECHGAEGEGGEIVGVEGLEGVTLAPLNSTEFLYTRTDETIQNVINYGQPDLGMPPYGLAYGGELATDEIEAIVVFMRYGWDDRVELPADTAASGVPELAEDGIPNYVDHIEPIIRRTCVSCHREGKENGNYFMTSYEETINSGDHMPNLIAGDLGSNVLRMMYREEIEAGGPMPPTKALKEEWLDLWERWVMAGMPETADDAAALIVEEAEQQPSEEP